MNIRVDENVVRSGLASKVGALTLENEMLMSAITILQAENGELAKQVSDKIEQPATDQ